MKRLTSVAFDDDATLIAMANNARLGSYDALLQSLGVVQASYTAYATAQGNALICPPPCQLPNELKQAMQSHFERPPKILKGILREIRREKYAGVCPMCGSFGRSDLDHVLPQAVYPEFSFFTKNLVPACGCNSLRSAAVSDANGGRVLHPYFDNLLQMRLLRATFQGNFPKPQIDLEICCGAIPERLAVEFHVEHVVRKTAIISHMEAHCWPTLLRRPHTVPELSTATSLVTFQAALERVVTRYDEEFETPNNWNSVFYSGLARHQALCEQLYPHIMSVLGGQTNPDEL